MEYLVTVVEQINRTHKIRILSADNESDAKRRAEQIVTNRTPSVRDPVEFRVAVPKATWLDVVGRSKEHHHADGKRPVGPMSDRLVDGAADSQRI